MGLLPPFPGALTDFLAIVGLITSVAGLVLGWLFYVKQTVSQISWKSRAINLLDGPRPLIEGLEIRYDGQLVEEISISKIVVWNSGKPNIEDRSPLMDPLRISRRENNPEVAVLRGDVGYVSEHGCEVDAPGVSDGHLPIQFKNLTSSKGAIFYVVHTGSTSEDVCIRGTIRGVNKVDRHFDYFEDMRSPFAFIKRIMLHHTVIRVVMPVYTVVSLYILASLPAIAFLLDALNIDPDSDFSWRVWAWWAASAYGVLVLVLLWVVVRRWIPRDIAAAFFEDR